MSLATENIGESRVLVIERASPKHKRDNKISRTSDRVKRIRADISDLVLDKMGDVSKSKKVIGMAKHLCGEATGWLYSQLIKIRPTLVIFSLLIID